MTAQQPENEIQADATWHQIMHPLLHQHDLDDGGFGLGDLPTTSLVG